jgi:hypothetical protein
MIKVQREKKELEAKEKELLKKKRFDEEVLAKEKKIANSLRDYQNQRNATEIYFLDLESQKRGMFKLVKEEVCWKEQICDYEDGNKYIVWETECKDTKYHIEVIDTKYKIYVKEQLVYNSSWSRTATNKGYKMYLYGADYKEENRAISSAKTMFNKIESYIEYVQDKKKSLDDTELAKQLALAKLKSDFPDLEFKYEQNWVRSAYTKEGGTYENRIECILENNKVMHFHYNLSKIYGENGIYVGLTNWNGFDYKEVITAIRQLKQVK